MCLTVRSFSFPSLSYPPLCMLPCTPINMLLGFLTPLTLHPHSHVARFPQPTYPALPFACCWVSSPDLPRTPICLLLDFLTPLTLHPHMLLGFLTPIAMLLGFLTPRTLHPHMLLGFLNPLTLHPHSHVARFPHPTYPAP